MSQRRKEDVDLMNKNLTQIHNICTMAQKVKRNAIQKMATDGGLYFFFQKTIVNFPKNE